MCPMVFFETGYDQVAVPLISRLCCTQGPHPSRSICCCCHRHPACSIAWSSILPMIALLAGALPSVQMATALATKQAGPLSDTTCFL